MGEYWWWREERVGGGSSGGEVEEARSNEILRMGDERVKMREGLG